MFSVFMTNIFMSPRIKDIKYTDVKQRLRSISSFWIILVLMKV